MYYRTCSHCGANLDPGETCDCDREREMEKARMSKLIEPERNGQMKMNLEEVQYEKAASF